MSSGSVNMWVSHHPLSSRISPSSLRFTTRWFQSVASPRLAFQDRLWCAVQEIETWETQRPGHFRWNSILLCYFFNWCDWESHFTKNRIQNITSVNSSSHHSRSFYQCMCSQGSFRQARKTEPVRCSWGSSCVLIYIYIHMCISRKPAARLGEVLFANKSELRGRAGEMWPKSRNWAQWSLDNWNIFEGYVPGGNWVTVGYRFPPGPSSEVHLGRR